MFRLITGRRLCDAFVTAKETIYKIPLNSEQTGWIREVVLVVPSEVFVSASNRVTEVSHILVKDFTPVVAPLRSFHAESSCQGDEWLR